MTTATTTTGAPQVAVNDIGSADDFMAAIDATIKYFNDGDIVEGTIVKVDRDEVLLDIGYKTEGVIPSRELSIKHDVDPSQVVSVGDHVEALVLTKEDKEGRLILSKKRAQYERAWGTIERIKEEDGVVEGSVIEVVKGGLILDIGLRGFLPASLVEMRRVRDLQPYVGKTLEAKIIELDKNRNNVVLSRRAWLEQTQSEVAPDVPHPAAEGPDPQRRRLEHRQLRCLRRPRRGGRPGARVGAVLEAHRPPVRGRRGRPGGHRRGARRRHGPRARVAVAEGDAGGSVAALRPDPPDRPGRPGKVTKLVPFGAFVRVEEGIEGLVHISELAERHVELPEQVVQVNDDIFVKVIDIDLERRRISLSLKQANESADGVSGEEFDPYLYGMAPAFDEAGDYIGPDGFDPETGEWKAGFEDQRSEWEQQYAEAHARWEAHRKQVSEAREADQAALSRPARPCRRTPPSRPTPRARLPRTRRCRHCATSSPASSRRVTRRSPVHADRAPSFVGWRHDQDRAHRRHRLGEEHRGGDAGRARSRRRGCRSDRPRPGRAGGRSTGRPRDRVRTADPAGGRQSQPRGARRPGLQRPPCHGPTERHHASPHRCARLAAGLRPRRRLRSSSTTCPCWWRRAGRPRRRGRRRGRARERPGGPGGAAARPGRGGRATPHGGAGEPSRPAGGRGRDRRQQRRPAGHRGSGRGPVAAAGGVRPIHYRGRGDAAGN